MYKIEISDEPGFLRFDIEGNQDRQTDADIDREIASECIERGAKAALVDIRRLAGRLSILENHEAAKSFRQRMPLSLRRIAIIDLPEHAARSEMYEVTAQNRGARLRFFDSVTLAQEWLRSERDRGAAT